MSTHDPSPSASEPLSAGGPGTGKELFTLETLDSPR